MLTKVDRIGKDDRALSAIVGVVLVLAVTVVAGLALYMWWNSMQSASQSTVGEQTKAQIGQMIREHGTVSITIPGRMTNWEKKYNYHYTSTSFDWDNDKVIYKPPSSGFYVGSTYYENCYKDERFIVEIPVVIHNPNTFDLTGVELIVGGLEGRLWFVLHFKKTPDGQYVLLDKNGTEFAGVLGYGYANKTDSDSDYYKYYWGEPGSYGINGSKEMLNYSSSGNLTTTTKLNYTDYQAWGNRSTTIFANNTWSPLVLRDEHGNNLYPYACKNGNCTNQKYAWATFNNFFTGKSGGPTYAFCKDNLHNPVYDIGTIKAGQSVKTYVYVLFGYLAERTGTLPEWEITLEVHSNEGVEASLPVKFRLDDPDWA